jgi:uncharacterized lipoprotein YmbA
MSLSRRAAFGTLAALAACRSAEPNLYTIGAVPGDARRGGPQSISLREVSLAQYLDRQSIVRSAADYRLEVSSNDWWGEPLAGMVTRVLAENLGQRLPGTTVVQTGGAITVPSQAVVEVNIQRMGITTPGTLTLAAQVAVNQRDGRRGAALHLRDLLTRDLADNPIAVADHCYACTAGQGSSCGGALAA